MEEMMITQTTEELLGAIGADVHQLMLVLQTLLVVVGILISFVLVRLIWRVAFKKALRFIRF